MFIHLMSNEGKIISFLYLTLPHVFSLFFPVNEGWSCLVNVYFWVFFLRLCWLNASSAFIFRDFMLLLILFNHRIFDQPLGYAATML